MYRVAVLGFTSRESIRVVSKIFLYRMKDRKQPYLCDSHEKLTCGTRRSVDGFSSDWSQLDDTNEEPNLGDACSGNGSESATVCVRMFFRLVIGGGHFDHTPLARQNASTMEVGVLD